MRFSRTTTWVGISATSSGSDSVCDATAAATCCFVGPTIATPAPPLSRITFFVIVTHDARTTRIPVVKPRSVTPVIVTSLDRTTSPLPEPGPTMSFPAPVPVPVRVSASVMAGSAVRT